MNYLGFKIAEAAQGLIGTPWHLQGRLPGVGIDCVGVMFCAFQSAGVKLRDFASYTQYPDVSLLVNKLDEQMDEVRDDLWLGDVLAFAMPGTRESKLGHVGIYVGDGRMVHITPERAKLVTVAELTDSYRRRIVGIYRARP